MQNNQSQTIYSGLWCRNLQLYRLLVPVFPPEVLGKAGSGAALWCGGAVVLLVLLCWSGTEVVLLRRGGGGDAFYSFYSTSSGGKHACSPRHLFKLLSLTRGDQFSSILQTLWYQHSTMVNTIELETNLHEVWSFTIKEKQSRCEIGLQAQQRS